MLPEAWNKEIKENILELDRHQNTVEGALNGLGKQLADFTDRFDRREGDRSQRELKTIRWLFLTAAFTLALALASLLQAWAFIQSERAALTVTRVSFNKIDLTTDQPISIGFDVHNGGKSRATIEDMKLKLATKLERAPTFIANNSLGVIPISPAATMIEIWYPTDNSNKSISFTQDQVQAIQNATTHLYVQGSIVYSDDFWPSRNEPFCFKYLPGNGPGGWFPCPKQDYDLQ
jgi:hypothetical protein